MENPQTTHDGAFKAKVAIEALREVAPADELASKYEVDPTIVGEGKATHLEKVPKIFSKKRRIIHLALAAILFVIPVTLLMLNGMVLVDKVSSSHLLAFLIVPAIMLLIPVLILRYSKNAKARFISTAVLLSMPIAFVIIIIIIVVVGLLVIASDS